MFYLGFKEYLKGLKDYCTFFACYNLDADIEMVDKHLKELNVKFNDSNATEDDSFKTCIDRGDVDGTSDTHLTEVNT